MTSVPVPGEPERDPRDDPAREPDDAPPAADEQPTIPLGATPASEVTPPSEVETPTASEGDAPTAPEPSSPSDTTPSPPPGGATPPPPPGGAPPPPPPPGFPPPGAGFPPPGGFPPPPPGTAGFATRYGLVRPRNGRYFAGVCAAVARATNTDPVLWRVLTVVLTFVGGIGLLAYLIGWLLIPSEGDSASPVEALVWKGRSSTSAVTTVVLLILAAITFGAVVDRGFHPGLVVLAALLAAVLLITRHEGGRGPGGAGQPPVPPGEARPMGGAGPLGGTEPPTTPMATAPTAESGAATAGYPTPPAGYRPPFAPRGPYAGPGGYPGPAPGAGPSPYPYPGLTPPGQPPMPPTPPMPPAPSGPRGSSLLGRLTVSVALLVTGVLGLLDITGMWVPASAYVAAALAVVGLGLLVGTWWGRSRALIAVGLALTIALGALTLVEQHPRPLAPRGGNVTWIPSSVSDLAPRYDNQFGNSTLDLRRVDFTGRDETVDVRVAFGRLDVLLPPTVDTSVEADLFAGDAVVFGDSWGGLNSGVHAVTDNGVDGPGGGHLRLLVHVNAGNLEVHR